MPKFWIHYLEDAKEQLEHCCLIGDKGYLSHSIQLDLFENKDIKLEAPMRKI